MAEQLGQEPTQTQSELVLQNVHNLTPDQLVDCAQAIVFQEFSSICQEVSPKQDSGANRYRSEISAYAEEYTTLDWTYIYKEAEKRLRS